MTISRRPRAAALPVLLGVAALLCGLRLAAADAPAATPKVAFEKYTLANGLQVILHVDRKLPIVHVNQWYHVGAKNERRGRTGFAHLFEHMMFQGSKNAPGEYFSYAEKAGANLFAGGVNGTTNQDRTNYFATVPSANLENLLWLESDRLATLLDALDQAKLDNQRDVVKNERRQNYENTPYGRAFPVIFESLFPAGHPYSWPAIGSQEDLSAASLEDVQGFFRRYYSTNNLSLVIAGDFDPAEAKRLVDKYFSSLQPGPALERPGRDVARLDGERIVEVADRVPQERAYIVWPTPEYFADGDADLDLAARVLADGLSSRLSRALVYDRQLASDVNAFQAGQEIAGFFAVIATARPEASLAEIEKLIDAEIQRLAKSGPTQAELDRARTKQEFQYVSGLERIGGFGGKADLLNQYNTFLGDPDGFERDLGRYRKATVQSVQAAVGRWLDNGNRLLVRFHPETSGRPSEAAIDRSQQPALGHDRPFIAPKVEGTKLANGMEVLVAERHDLPKVALALVTRAGTGADPAGKEGLANLTAQTLDMGTKAHPALAIEEAFGDLGCDLFAFAGREATQVGLEVLKRNLSPALAVMADVVRNPTFPEQEIARERDRQLDSLEQQSRDGSAVASRVRAVLAFGSEHPYGKPGQGLPESVKRLTREDLATFHAAQYRPASTALVFVGDLTLDEARRLAEEHWGSWSGGAAPSLVVPPAKPAVPGRIYLVDRQDAAQSVVSEFMPAPKRSSADYDALQLADTVWGGAATSRLNANLREDKGYSYGVFSNVLQYNDSGLWYAGGGIQTAKTAPALTEFIKELRDIGSQRPITPEEFENARLQRVRGYAQEFEAYQQVAGTIAQLWSWGLPMSELQAQSDRLAGVTLDAARAAAARYAKPEASAIVVVGDRATIEPSLRELKAGEIVVIDDEGKPTH